MDVLMYQPYMEEASSLIEPILKSNRIYEDSTKTFSFFETVSDHYYRETFHSDILYSLLNPETTEIGSITSKTFLRRFLELINVPFDSNAKFVVKKEEEANTTDSNGRIDLSIVGNGYSIIIENKINNAAEQENQLARYVESQRNKNPNTIICIVYLTLTPNKSQEPSIDCYSKEYFEIVNEIKKRKIPLYLWAASNTNKLEGWLDKSLIDLLDDCINEIGCKTNTDSAARTTLVFMGQYRNLLNRLGGVKMEYDEKRKVLDYLVDNKETFLELFNIWNEKDSLFNKYFSTKYSTDDKQWEIQGFGPYTVYIMKSLPEFKVYLSLESGVQLGLIFNNVEVGRSKEKKAKDAIQTILEKNQSIQNYGIGASASYGVYWVYFVVKYNLKPFKDAFQETAEFINSFSFEFPNTL